MSLEKCNRCWYIKICSKTWFSQLKIGYLWFRYWYVKNCSVDLYQLSNVVEKQVVKKTVFDELVEKINTIQTIDASNLVKKADCNTKID